MGFVRPAILPRAFFTSKSNKVHISFFSGQQCALTAPFALYGRAVQAAIGLNVANKRLE
jgi:hypothetical protein